MKKSTHSLLNWLPLATAMLLLTGYYILLTNQTIKSGLQNPENLYYLSKLMLEINTPYFYFLDFNSYQPPLPYFAALLFRNPYAANIAVGIFFALFVFWLTIKKRYILTLIFLLFSYFFLYLPLLYLFTSKLQMGLYFFLFCLCNFFLIRFIKNRKIYDIFYFGLLYGLSYFTLYEAIYLVPLYFLIIFITTPDIKLDHKLSLILVAFMPIVFMFLSWSYLCWLFTGQARIVVSSTPYYLRFMVYLPTSLLRDNLIDIFLSSFKFTFIYYAFLPMLFLQKDFWRSPLTYFYLSPLFLLLLKTISWGTAPEFYEYTIFILIIPVVFYFFDFNIDTTKATAKTIIPLIFAIFLIIGNIAFYNYASREENQFARVIARQELHVEERYYKEIADLLNETSGRIIMDDDILHPVITCVADTNRFLLPYNLDFKTGLNNPSLIADHIVMTDRPYADRIAKIWPPRKEIPGFTLIYASEGLYLYSKYQ